MTFFVGNLIVIALSIRGSDGVSDLYNLVFIGLILAAVICLFAFERFTVFWAEWLSLVAISGHFVVSSLDGRYRPIQPRSRHETA